MITWVLTRHTMYGQSDIGIAFRGVTKNPYIKYTLYITYEFYELKLLTSTVSLPAVNVNLPMSVRI